MDNMVFAERVKAIRESKGLSMSEVARRLNMDRSAYYRIESQKRDCRISFVYKIAKALEVDPKVFI